MPYCSQMARVRLAPFFGDASENGEDVFIFTRQSLAGQDRDQNVDVYDVRENGGIAAQSPEPGSPACASEQACRGSESVSGPVFGTPSSATFAGAGNLGAAGAFISVEPEVAPKRSPNSKPPPSRAQKLAAALRACGKRHMRRMRCRMKARKRYGAQASKRDRRGRR